MKFELLPVLDLMEDLYRQPRSPNRFQTYLKHLQGTSKKDMELPIASFNPMAKEHVLDQLETLQSMQAEYLAQQVIEKINSDLNRKENRVIKVALNLADDLKGGWTNRFTTDYDSKFKLNALVTRGFCTPIFWSSELYSEYLIKNRIREYVFRTLYWLDHPKPETLEDHFNQELFVQRHLQSRRPRNPRTDQIQAFYQTHHQSDAYNVIFNFFYGDEACTSLGFPTYGVSEIDGFAYAKVLASH